MDTKKYFYDNDPTIVNTSDAAALEKDAESLDHVKVYSEQRQRFVPHTDFTSASNFAFFGSAEQYYEDTIKRIYQTYPYDGSLYEKTAWHLTSSYFDNYIFENEYPRTNGFINLDSGTLSSLSNQYGRGSASQYIIFRGGPHPSSREKGKEPLNTSGDYKSGYSNYLDLSENRESNIKIDGADGNTVEFWMKKAQHVPNAYKEVVFDTYTVNASNDNSLTSGYGRLRIELEGVDSSTSPWLITYLSGTYGFSTASIGQSVTETTVMDNNWHHYAFVFENSGSNLQARLYIDGNCNDTITGSTFTMPQGATATVDYVSGGMYATIGALSSAPSGTTIPTLGDGPLSASLDEFRFWKVARTPEQIGRYWFAPVGAGTNTDDSNTHLGIYYKFNEGISTDTTLDANVLDYSGRVSNGTIVNYTTEVRSTDSAIVLSNEASASSEFKDPILYPTHPDVDSYLISSIAEGKQYDYGNAASIYNSLPAWIINDDSSKELKKLIQILASYFDTLQLQINELPKIKNINYPTGSYYKPYPFISQALESKGFLITELFADANVLEQFLNRSEKELFEEKLYDVKNFIYQNIYNVLVNIYKSKGTEKSIRNLIRCFGVDKELVKLNLYGHNVTFPIENNYTSTTINKNCVDFTHPDRYSATVYQFTSSTNANSVSYISGALDISGSSNYALPFTTEAEIIFPKKTSMRNEGHKFYSSLTSSLFGMHTAEQPRVIDVAKLADTTWNDPDEANFQVYAMRKTLNESVLGGLGYTAKDAYFKLTGSAGGHFPELTSSVFRNVYDNSKWNFAVRLKPNKHPLAAYVSGSLESADNGTPNTYTTSYIVEFYGVNSDLDIISNEFLLTGTLSKAQGEAFLSSSKRVYAGSHRTNFTGTLLDQTDVSFSSLRCWLDYLDNETIKAHSKDPHNYGRLHPYRPAYLFEILLPEENGAPSKIPHIPQIETLALHWDFTGITGSGDSSDGLTTTSDAKFTVTDMSSGSSDSVIAKAPDSIGDYAKIGRVVDAQHTGRGDFFLPFDTNSISKEYIFSAQQNLPENLHSEDLVKIMKRDDTIFKSTTLPVTHFFALEKSMYQTISEEMLKLFATIVDFNNLIGEPVHRYRQNYKTLGKLRQLYFEKYVDEPGDIVYPDFEKFIDYYKWIDSAISAMVYQLVPGSARFGERLRNMIESHILERNKYWNKFPTLDFASRQFDGKGRLPSDGDIGSNLGDIKLSQGNPTIRHTSIARASVNQTSVTKTMGYSVRNQMVKGSSAPAPQEGMKKFSLDRTEESISSGDATIDNARQKIFKAVIRTGAPFGGTNTYNFGISMDTPLRSGVNAHLNKKTTFFRTLINNVTDDTNAGLEISDAIVKEDNYSKATRDIKRPEKKKRRYTKSGKIELRGTDNVGYTAGLNSKLASPFSLYSSSVDTGYNSILVSELTGTGGGYGVDFANLHQDVYAPNYEVPLQGPFTEKWVGGLPYRHVSSQFNFNGNPDTRANRLEGWLIIFEEDSSGKYAVFKSPTSASVHNPRSMFWKGPKRPVNIENIRATTGSGGPHDPSGVTKIGNYSRDYEIVQTSGRSVNNRTFVKNEGNYITWLTEQKPDSATLPIEKVSNFTTIDRSSNKNKYIFTERFGAPGGPELAASFLDLESGELSPYNALPYRNLSVRLLNNEILTNHVNPFGFYSDTQYSSSWQLAIDSGFQANASYGGTATTVSSLNYEGSGSHYKINRNARQKIKFVGTTGYNGDSGAEDFVTGTVYDNYWVQHALPQSDGQYSWISASITSPMISFSRPNPIYASRASDDISFLTSSMIGASDIMVDFAGLNTLIYDPLDAASNTLSASSGDYRNTSILSITQPEDLNGLILHRQGPYGWPSWKQIRGAQHPIARRQRSNNTSSLYYESDRKLYQYNEPPITSRYSPMVHIFKPIGSKKPVVLKHTYGNNLSTFAHSDLNKKLGFYKTPGKETYDKLKLTYLGAAADNTINLSNIYHKESIWPREINVFLSKTRTRKNYVVDFWRDAHSNRSQTNIVNTQNKTISSHSIWPLDARENFATAAPLTGGQDGAGELQNNYVIYHGGHNGIVPGAIYARPISSSATNLIYGDTKWEAGSQSGKNPFYDSYSNFSEDIRRVAKDYSIIPEFRISDQMGFYLDEKAENFFVKANSGFLTLTGSNHAASDEAGFFKTYAHSDFLKHFSTIREDHDGFASPTEISFTCKAVKKFIPYDGFYPASRTLQLASLFNSSYTDSTGMTDVKRRISLAPFFAPGILYNTIKSGVAVDWPIYTSQPSNPYWLGNTGNVNTLNPYRLTQSFDRRIPFDGLVQPEKYLGTALGEVTLFEAEPDPHARYTINAATGSVKLNQMKSKTYKLAMHNFLAESISFFLKGSSMTKLVSKTGPYTVDPAKEIYKMRIVLTDTMVMRAEPRIFSMYNRASAFGPTVDKGSSGGDYAPFTPPYYNVDSTTGYAHVELAFTPWKHTVAARFGTEGSDEYTLDEILANSTKTYFRVLAGASTNYDNAMHITASINVFGKTIIDPTKDPDLSTVWTIQPRFETPMLNFTDVSKTSPSSGNASAKGMWHQYGTIETDGSKGIFLGIVDIPDADVLTGSLADLVGFKTGLTKLGQLPLDKERTMREAIVAIPFVKKVDKKTGGIQTIFINLYKNQVIKASTAIDKGLSYEDVQKSCTKSIYDMVSAMKRYVIPPRFDFLTQIKVNNSKKIKPFSMYIFEFEHEFSQQDIADIWQNLPPDIGTEFKVDEKTIGHKLGKDNLLSEKDLKNPNLHWIVFKVKQKAKVNYFDATADYQDDTSDSLYSYNWPYDFCSLVELAKIETEIKFDRNKDMEIETDSEKEIKQISKIDLDEPEKGM